MAVHPIDLGEMMDALADRLECERPDNHFTDARLIRWINYGIIEFARRTKACIMTQFLDLSANVQRYTCPAEWLRAQKRQVLYLRDGTLTGYQYALKKRSGRGMQAVMGTLRTDFLSAATYCQPSTGPPQEYMLDGAIIQFHPIPAATGSNQICFKFPGIPDGMRAVSATPTAVPLEHRMLCVDWAEHLGMLFSKDIRANDARDRFYADCETVEGEIKWEDVDEPPSMLPEEYFAGAEDHVI